MNDQSTTHFGYQQVPVTEKEKRVASVFDSVAARYDLMNDLMSGGVHRLWKRYTIERSGVRPGQQVLDIAGGTGDLTRQFAKRVGPKGLVVLADINASMLQVGREKLLNQGYIGNIDYLQCNAESLPFPENSFHCISIAFGLRNVTDKQAALNEMHRVLKPGGKAMILEFSHPENPLLSKAYDTYSFTALPLMGQLIAQDSESYRYLAESIRMHPDQETLRSMLDQAGFVLSQYTNLTGGIVALHTGIKA